MMEGEDHPPDASNIDEESKVKKVKKKKEKQKTAAKQTVIKQEEDKTKQSSPKAAEKMSSKGDDESSNGNKIPFWKQKLPFLAKTPSQQQQQDNNKDEENGGGTGENENDDDKERKKKILLYGTLIFFFLFFFSLSIHYKGVLVLFLIALIALCYQIETEIFCINKKKEIGERMNKEPRWILMKQKLGIGDSANNDDDEDEDEEEGKGKKILNKIKYICCIQWPFVFFCVLFAFFFIMIPIMARGKGINPKKRKCPSYTHEAWPITCPTNRTYELMKQVCQPMINEGNRYRKSRGMQPFIWNDNLAFAAQIMASYSDNPLQEEYESHTTPGSPFGTTLDERLISANYGTNFTRTEGNAGTANYGTIPKSPTSSNPMLAFCKFKDAWKGDCGRRCGSHFSPFTNYNVKYVHDLYHIGCGWSGTKWTFVYGAGSSYDPPIPPPPLSSIDPSLACS